MSHDSHFFFLAQPAFACPQCHEPTEVVDRFTLGGSPGSVEHVKVICDHGHWFTLPLEKLAMVSEQPGAAESVEAVASEKAA